MFGTVTTIAALLLIASLITIHEFGHFLVAKACGVDVRVFSIGFGGRMVGVTWRGTDYRISWIPLGGYVRMAGADPMMDGGVDDEEVHGPGSFMAKPAWQRLLISLAGPAMNLVLPVFVFSALMVVGEPQPRSEVGAVRHDSPAEASGVLPADRIVAVAGVPVLTWEDVADVLEDRPDGAPGGGIDLVLERDASRFTLRVPAEAGVKGFSAISAFGVLAYAQDASVVVDDPASPAGRAGVLSFDVLLKVGDRPVANWRDAERELAAATDVVPVEVRRSDEEEESEVVALTLRADASWTPTSTEADTDAWRRWGVTSASLAVGQLSETSAAKAAGVEKGDRMIAIDGRPVLAFSDVLEGVSATVTEQVKGATARPVKLTVRRAGELREFEITPAVSTVQDAGGRFQYRPLLGIYGGGDVVAPPLVPRPYPVQQAVPRAIEQTVRVAGIITETLGKIVTNEVKLGDNIGGPVEIFYQTRAAAERGVMVAARNTALFSISIGIFNLLPIPVLDGGNILVYFAEWVRGRPLPLALRERAQQVGIIFLVLLILFVVANDIHRRAFL